MATQKELKKRLKTLMKRPENQVCSDCPDPKPTWASIIVPPTGSPEGAKPLGAFCCYQCSGSHRRLGVHISFVRSCTLDDWKEKEIEAMENGGNTRVNAIFEGGSNFRPALKIQKDADCETREKYIRDKYEHRLYFSPAAFKTSKATNDATSAILEKMKKRHNDEGKAHNPMEGSSHRDSFMFDDLVGSRFNMDSFDGDGDSGDDDDDPLAGVPGVTKRKSTNSIGDFTLNDWHDGDKDEEEAQGGSNVEEFFAKASSNIRKGKPKRNGKKLAMHKSSPDLGYDYGEADTPQRARKPTRAAAGDAEKTANALPGIAKGPRPPKVSSSQDLRQLDKSNQSLGNVARAPRPASRRTASRTNVAPSADASAVSTPPRLCVDKENGETAADSQGGRQPSRGLCSSHSMPMQPRGAGPPRRTKSGEDKLIRRHARRDRNEEDNAPPATLSNPSNQQPSSEEEDNTNTDGQKISPKSKSRLIIERFGKGKNPAKSKSPVRTEVKSRSLRQITTGTEDWSAALKNHKETSDWKNILEKMDENEVSLSVEQKKTAFASASAGSARELDDAMHRKLGYENGMDNGKAKQFNSARGRRLLQKAMSSRGLDTSSHHSAASYGDQVKEMNGSGTRLLARHRSGEDLRLLRRRQGNDSDDKRAAQRSPRSKSSETDDRRTPRSRTNEVGDKRPPRRQANDSDDRRTPRRQASDTNEKRAPRRKSNDADEKRDENRAPRRRSADRPRTDRSNNRSRRNVGDMDETETGDDRTRMPRSRTEDKSNSRQRRDDSRDRDGGRSQNERVVRRDSDSGTDSTQSSTLSVE